MSDRACRSPIRGSTIAGLLVVALVLTVALSPYKVAANTSVVEDPRDTGDVLDLDVLSHGHGKSSAALLHTFSTFEPWTDEEFVYAEYYFWLSRGRCPWFVLKISRRDLARGQATIFHAGCDGEALEYAGPARVIRQGERTVKIKFSKGVFKGQGFKEKYWWKVFLHFPCSREPGVQCSPPPPDTHERVLHEL